MKWLKDLTATMLALRTPKDRLRAGGVTALLPLLLLVLLAFGVLGAALPAQAQTEVGSDWALKPSGVLGGDEFRLLFITLDTRKAESTDIADYNTFVQNAAAAGHQAIQSHSSGFRVVGCTTAVDARDNTSTTYTSADKGVPIYWLNGNKLADDYEDFYDGSWDDEANPKYESGEARPVSDFSGPAVGCFNNGIEYTTPSGGATVSRALGETAVVIGMLGNGPIGGGTTREASSYSAFYALSGVFRVRLSPATGQPGISGFPRVGDELTASADDIADLDGLTGARYEYQWVRVDGTSETDIALANGTTYRLAGADLGKTVKVRVSFTDDAGNAESVTSNAFPDGGVLPKAVCKAPTYKDGQREIWKAELRGGNAGEGYYGYEDEPSAGSLSDTTFTYWGEEQTISFLGTNVAQRLVGISFVDAPPPIFGAIQPLTLHVCDEEFRFGAAHDQIRTFFWFPFVRDWSAHSTRTVRLSVDDVAPSFVSAKLDGKRVIVTMSEALDGRFVPPRNHFELKVDEVLTPLAATNPVSVSGNTFTLTLASAPAASATVTVSLIIGGGGFGLRDLAWNPVRIAELDERPVTHYNVPLFQSAELAADGATLTLTYDEALDTSSVPAPVAFTVKGGGAVKRVSSVSVSGPSVRLALASDPPGSTVTVSYAAPAANPLRDAARNNAASFTDEAVTIRRAGPPDQLVGNLAQPRVFTHEFFRSLATSFTTGKNAGGYAIAGVDVATGDGRAFDASLCATLGSGRPTDQCVTLLRSADFHGASGRARFTAPAGTVLSPGTRYALVVSLPESAVSATQQPDLRGTHSRRADAGRAQDWYLHAEVRWADRETGSWNSGGAGRWRTPLMFAVRGAPVPEPAPRPPGTSGKPGISEAGTDGRWTSGETVQVTIAFDEAVTVETTSGTPSVALRLGGSAERSAGYASGSDTGELVFEYTLVAEDGTHTAMEVTANSLALNGGTIRSMASATDAALAHEGASRVVESTGVTARFEAIPASHDGERTFSFELHFNVAPSELSYRRVQGSMTLGNGDKVPFFEVSGGEIAHARRLVPGSNQAWEVTVRPTQAGDLTITLPAGLGLRMRDGWAGLLRTVTATVKGVALTVPLTAAFANVPEEHDGTNRFEVHFNLSVEPAPMSYVTARDALFAVTGGSIVNASRAQRDQNQRWILVVAPSGNEDVTLTVNETTACDAEPGICTSDGRMLAGGATATIRGPAKFSVADAEVDEAAGATLDFVVTLSRARPMEATVSYATSDGTATAGSDYTATSGGLTFAPGDTSKTVSVPVLEDAVDEGSETLTLTLSNPSAAIIDDGEATGTINNTDPLPKAWIARFGRTVATHVLDAVEERLQGGASKSYVRLGGHQLGGLSPEASEAMHRLAPDRDLWEEVRREAGPAGQDTTLGELLLGSAFHLVSNAEDSNPFGPSLTAWGRVATSGFDGNEDRMALSGTVTTATLGVDGVFRRWLTGVALAYSEGDGSFTHAEAPSGDLTSTLTSVHPYVGYALSDRVKVWGMVGYGSGALEVVVTGQEPLHTDLDMTMGALGVRGTVLSTAAGLELAIRSDVLWVNTSSAAVPGMVQTEADTNRLRLVLEGSRPFSVGAGGTLTPTLELGLRRDGGDAEEGSGVEVGGRLHYASPSGLSIEAALRALVAHEASEYQEWGASGALRYDPGQAGLGLTASITPTWGMASSGVGRLWSQPDARGLASGPGLSPSAAARVDAELGYGLRAMKGQGLLTPYARASLVEGSEHAWHLGTRLALAESLNLSLEATHRQRLDDAAAHELALLATVPW